MINFRLTALLLICIITTGYAQTNVERLNKSIYTSFDTTITHFENSPIGFASVNALGQDGTTGGAGGDTLVFSDTDALQNFLQSRNKESNPRLYPPKVLLLRGTFELTDLVKNTYKGQLEIKNTGDLTLIGDGDNVLFNGIGIHIVNCINIIIRNIELGNCKPDAITITTTSKNSTHHIWIDHCSLSDSPEVDNSSSGSHDGLLDITHRTDYVTVSWCHFYNHNKNSLLGYTDGDTTEIGRLKTTYHHNWFDNTTQRNPRVRHTECHVFNNYYDGTKGGFGMGATGYGIASTDSADVVVEANYFDSVKAPTHIGEGNSGPGDLVSINNITVNSGPILTQGLAFNPLTYYSYEVDNPEKVPAIVTKYAGSGKFDFLPTDVAERNDKSYFHDFKLEQNYPNPFNPATTINYSIPFETKDVSSIYFVSLKIYDVLGRETATLVNGVKYPGMYNVTFNAGNLKSGIYFYKLTVNGNSVTRKMILLK